MNESFIDSRWFRIWVEPRAVLREVLDRDPRSNIHWLAMLGGIGFLMGELAGASAGKYFPLFVIFFLCVLIGPLSGLFFLYLEAALLTWTGRWLDGKGSQVELRAASAWSSIPYIWLIGFLLFSILFFGNELFQKATPRIDALPFMLKLVMGIIMVGSIVWSWVITLKCVAEAHGFSAWKALATVFLARLLEVAAWGVPTLMFYGIGKVIKAYWGL